MTFSLPSRLLFCAFLVLLTYTNAKLVVKYPDSLAEQIDRLNGIDYMVLTPQNKITYKRAFIGVLSLAEPTSACEHIPSISELGKDMVYNPILLATWGECHYAQKVKNAENAGAKMVLVVLNHDMNFNHAAIRQLTINTNVEVLAIAHTDGQKLIDYINNANAAGSDPSIELTYSYEVEKHVNFNSTKDGKVLIDFWFASGDVRKDAYNFLDMFQDVLKDFINDNVTFVPHYVLWDCEGCGDQDRCISDGRYCDPEPLIAGKIPGKEAVNENVRQICFRELNGNSTAVVGDDWWNYVTAFSQCVEQPMDALVQCRQNILNGIEGKITKSVESCMKDAFNEKGESTLLTSEITMRDQMHIDHYPALYVNKQRYTESARNKNAIKEFICSHFAENLPATCSSGANVTTEEQYSGTDVGIYIVLIVISILVMAVMIYCVRRTVKREVMFKMNDEISHIVTQYKQFKDKSNSFSMEDET